MTRGDWHTRGAVVLGAGGMLGGELVAALRRHQKDAAEPRVVALTRAELDVGNRADVVARLRELRPSVVLNAAAYTDVDGCERDRGRALAVNAEGPGNVAAACAEVGGLLVHFGTDYIFDGLSDRPYRPEDPANPISMYGQSKGEGEEGVRGERCVHLIVRTSWLFGGRGKSFVETVLTTAEAGESLRVVNDQVGRPTFAADLADAVVLLLEADSRGTFHFANAGSCSWHELAQEVLRQAGRRVPLIPTSSAESGRAATRPRNSVLDTHGFTAATGDRPRPWREALTRPLREPLGGYGRDGPGSAAGLTL